MRTSDDASGVPLGPQGQATPPPDVPPEYNIDGSISLAESWVDFGESEAKVRALTSLTGNLAETTAYIAVRFDGQTVANNFSQVTEDTYLLPTTGSPIGEVTASLGASCGHQADGHASHRVWVEYGPFSWGATERPSTAPSDSQPGCPTEIVEEPGDGGGGSGSSGGGDAEPAADVYVCWYRYTYETGTGRILSKSPFYCSAF